MNTRQYLQLESITACLAVLDDPKFRTPAINGLYRKLEQATAEIRELGATQVGADISARSESIGLNVARKDVRQRLFRITRHAQAVLEGVPGIRDDLRVPHANAKDAEVIKAVGRIIKNLRPHMKSLHATGLPKESVPALEAAAKKLKAASSGSAGIARRSRATASIPGAIRRARALAKALDSAVRSEFAGESHLDRWEGVYRVPRKKGRPRKPRQQQIS